MNINKLLLRNTLIGLYLFSVNVYFGAITMDIIYSDIASRNLNISSFREIFSGGADFLLLIITIAFLLGILAIILLWKYQKARNLLISSLIFLSCEFIVPTLFLSIIVNIQNTIGVNISSYIRFICIFLASIFALIGQLRILSYKDL
jgi:hypothetical protein